MVVNEFVNRLNYLIQVDSVLKHARACLFSLCELISGNVVNVALVRV